MKTTGMTAESGTSDADLVAAGASCIYGIASKEDYEAMPIHMHAGKSLAGEQP